MAGFFLIPLEANPKSYLYCKNSQTIEWTLEITWIIAQKIIVKYKKVTKFQNNIVTEFMAIYANLKNISAPDNKL